MNKIWASIVAFVFGHKHSTAGVFVGRAMTHDESFKYRMRSGFSGDVNRTHPASIEPFLIDPTYPPSFYGCALINDNSAVNGVRGVIPADSTLTAISGVLVRPFPQQQMAATNYGATAFGNAAPPVYGPADQLVSGYIMTTPGGTAPTYKGAPVFVWVAASTGSHVQGGFEAAATAGSTLALDSKSKWNGPAGADGVAELAFNL